ncbi:hypothetical protein HNY73_020875 [Argiope bruennichi]|uniref:Uncharacterized protein n=1 Tax=Argiope bruennichi TaxID=94029 RepID=A0A8T0E9L6_ARGBR|nr:hypothetical protein HNY73_020875 [Argiope bruennichi]
MAFSLVELQNRMLIVLIAANLLSMYITYPSTRPLVLFFTALTCLCSFTFSMRKYILNLFEAAESSFALKIHDEL